MIAPGAPAPTFSLPDQDGRRVSLEDFHGSRVVLVFYPSDFSPVCTDQLNVYQEVLGALRESGVELVGISVDSAFCHKAFRSELGISIPLLADFHPKGEVARAYGLWVEEYGVAARALVMIGPGGLVEWVHRGSPLEVPGANLIFDALEQRTAA
jgi:peroxiredoxin (alkyl hydroperoxide reductase subunit C)